MKLAVEVIGWTGALLILGAYALLSAGKLKARSLTYHLMNIVGAAGFLVDSGLNGARPPGRIGFPGAPPLVAGGGVRVARHVRNTAPGDAVGRLGHRDALLPGRQRKPPAPAAAGGALVDARLVPHDLAHDRAAARGELGAPARQHRRARGGEKTSVMAPGLAWLLTTDAGVPATRVHQ